MENIGVQIFESINFYERYKALSEKTRTNEERLENTDKKIVTDIFKELGYNPKYVSKGQFYRIADSNNVLDFNLHLCIKYGVVEVIMGCKNNTSNIIFGGPAAIICESIEYSRSISLDGYVKDPSFGNYEVLEEIFKEVLSLYEDMKQATIKYNHSM